MGKIRIYQRKFPGTNRPDRFIVNEYANKRYHHHRTFATREAAEAYVETAIEIVPTPKVYIHKSAKESLQAIMNSDRYTFPKRLRT